MKPVSRSNLDIAPVTDLDVTIDDLKRTVAAMRERMEQMQFDQQTKIQDAVATLGSENAELKRTVAAMRSEMDRVQIAHSENVQDLTRAARDQHKQLQETIAALRDELEAKVGR